MKFNENKIRSMLNSTPRYRSFGFPQKSNCGLTIGFFNEEHFQSSKHLLEDLGDNIVITLMETKFSAVELAERLGIRFLLFPYAMKLVHRDVVICTHNVDRRTMMKLIMPTIWRYGRSNFYISDFKSPRPQPQLFEDNKDRIVTIANHLADEDSVACYIARLKAIIMGDAGYQAISSYFQYWHPLVRAEKDDIICDGGIGTTAVETLEFAKAAGQSGRVFGFEPIKRMHEKLVVDTAAFSTVEMVPMGLWSSPGEAEMFDAGNISTFRQLSFTDSAKSEICQLTSIDVFFEQKAIIPSVIKLDIEGAESNAISGGKSTIRLHKPKLQVCLYHSIKDFFDIPLQVLEYNPDYRLYVGHHTPFFNECVLYAR